MEESLDGICISNRLSDMEKSSLDHLMEQNETDLPFLSAYAGKQTIEEIFEWVRKVSPEEMEVKVSENGVSVSLQAANLPMVFSDIQGVGFANPFLSEDRHNMSVIITIVGDEQKRLMSRLNEFLA